MFTLDVRTLRRLSNLMYGKGAETVISPPAACERSRTVIPILQLSKGWPVHVIAISQLEGFYTHFTSRTLVCPGESQCRLCALGRPTRYIGWFAAEYEAKRYLVRLTSEAALRLIVAPPQPGYCYTLESRGQKRPISVSCTGTASLPEGRAMSHAELIKVLGCIHGLGLIASAGSAGDCCAEFVRRAARLVDHESLDF